MQEARFLECVKRAWKTPFYRRLWGEAGVEPGDIKGLETLSSLPSFDKSDIMDSIARNPPLGDFSAMDSYGRASARRW